MRLWLAIVCAFALWPVSVAGQVSLRVVFVDIPDIAHWTDLEKTIALADVQTALVWWHARGIPAPIDATDSGTIAVERVDSWQWLPEPSGGLVLYLVANTGASIGIGPQGAYAGAYVNRGRIVLLQETVIPRPIAIAHELGHALLLLPDWPVPPCRLDILCEPVAAYEAGVIGCMTMAALERPCDYVYLPEVAI